MPVDPLIEDFRSKRKEVLRKNSSWNSKPIDIDDLFTIVAPLICNRFGVSSEVIERRLRKENVLAHIG